MRVTGCSENEDPPPPPTPPPPTSPHFFDFIRTRIRLLHFFKLLLFLFFSLIFLTL